MGRNVNLGRERPDVRRLDTLNRTAKHELYLRANVSLLAEVKYVANYGPGIAGDRARAFAEALAKRSTSSTRDVEKVHYAVGLRAQAAILRSYKKKKVELGRNIPSYRQGAPAAGKRYSGQRMEAAIGDPLFFRATANELGLANQEMLDRRAAQWYRLNFGAAPADTPRPQRYPMKFNGFMLDDIGATGYPSKPFMLPKGVFTQQGAFYPKGPTPIHPTAGIRGWNYLDAGMAVIAKDIGPAYQQLYARWYELSKKELGPISRVKGKVPPPGRYRKIL